MKEGLLLGSDNSLYIAFLRGNSTYQISQNQDTSMLSLCCLFQSYEHRVTMTTLNLASNMATHTSAVFPVVCGVSHNVR